MTHWRVDRSLFLQLATGLLLASGFLMLSCDSDESDQIGTADGRARVVIALPGEAELDNVDYTLTFTFLDVEPSFTYNIYEGSSLHSDGELNAILPCFVGQDGTGLNSIDVAAKIRYSGAAQAEEVEKNAVFTCVRDSDTRVNMLLNVVRSESSSSR